MAIAEKEKSKNKKKGKKAKLALLRFLKKLRVACKTFQSGSDFFDILKSLKSILKLYDEVIPSTNLEEINETIKGIESGKKAIDQACKTLQLDIEKTISAIPVGAGLGSLLTSTFIAAAVVTGAAVGIFNYTAATIFVNTRACQEVSLDTRLEPWQISALQVVGFDLPNPIPGTGEMKLRVFPSVVEVDASQGDLLYLRAYGIRFPLGDFRGISNVIFGEGKAADLDYVQDSVMLRTLSKQIERGETYTLVVECLSF